MTVSIVLAQIHDFVNTFDTLLTMELIQIPLAYSSNPAIYMTIFN